MRKSCIKVLKREGEPIRRALLEMDLLDNSARICSEEDYLFLPLTEKPPESQLKELPGEFELTEKEFEEQKGQLKLEDLLDNAPHFEIVGDIALIEDDVPEPQKVADAIMKVKKNVKTVLAAMSPVQGEFRTRRFRTVAGEDRTSTIHREYGSRFYIDLERAYFTPRLATERSRILTQIKDGQTVVDMFAGVGPYSIMIARKSPDIKVIAIDKNPDAVEFLRHNVELNSTSNVEAIEGDANIEAEKFAGVADHVIMNLPHNANEFLDAAVKLCAPGAIIHYYDITHEDDLFDSSLKLIEEAAERAGRTIEVAENRVVRSYAPHQFNVCIEVRVL
ncbi:class I SAM-dependent methyltransferase family protein [Methanolobus mangrovi]|uniref:Class I SAM-dependent methyltransferase family protein n=1 Tax=Methanolobus mangrovi TaxID=3072977 RepID=A0AA51YK89_9EURY|nr:class I SAM-dependent methyltransferase family protein [Methanolobus mangrovi]WMW23388.1 class I SAM-dependent methyltransferase family protein [Methanolobus mangrovi]